MRFSQNIDSGGKVYTAENIWGTGAPKILKFGTNVCCVIVCGMNCFGGEESQA